MSNAPREDLQDRLVGKRFHNQSIDESFTIVGVKPPLVLIQYDDGTPWDEACAPELFAPDNAQRFGLSEGGIDDTQYLPLNGGGPTLDDACPNTQHSFAPSPSDLGIDSADRWHDSNGDTLVADAYHRAARCQRCGLSAAVLGQFLGHELPTVCDRCDSEVMPGETDSVFSPNPEWMDAHLCGDCAEVVEAEYEPYEVECVSCGDPLGTNEENSYIHSQSPLGEMLGGEDADSEFVFACNDCKDAAVSELND